MSFIRRRAHVAPVVSHMSTVAARLEVRQRAKAARREALILGPLVAGVLVAYRYRQPLFGMDAPIRAAASVALVALGWRFARDVGRAARPALFERVDPATAGTISFLIRLSLAAIALIVALRTAGLQPRELAVGGAFTAVVLGISAQNTIGNVISGLLLLSARPFRVGDRVRFQAGGLAGTLEGVVSSLGLLYVTLAAGEDTIMVPNIVAMNAAVVPLREPASVDLRARLKPEVKPSELQRLLENAVETPTRSKPHISLEEIDDDEVVMRIAATPEIDRDGPRLADEILAAVGEVTARDSGASGNGNGRTPPAAD